MKLTFKAEFEPNEEDRLHDVDLIVVFPNSDMTLWELNQYYIRFLETLTFQVPDDMKEVLLKGIDL